MNSLFVLWLRFKKSYKARVEHNKQPLDRENAYTLSILGKKGTYKNVLDNQKEEIIKTIKEEATLGNNYLLWKHLNKITPSQKKELIDYLIELGYQILYVDEYVILICWLWAPNDFKKNRM